MTRTQKILALLGVMLGTTLMGLILGGGTAFILSRFISNEFGGMGGFVAAGIGMAIGYPLGIIIGQVVIKRVFHFQGSLLWGAIGAVIGAAVPLGIGSIWPLLLPAGWGAGLVLVLSPLLGTLGYSLKRFK